ncbi:hypothetical protein [Flavihumibacter profundi]|uniref:hypothetical protein n=1 Tax=Flavihumibacter profundi TaxID=2716883 RepID=UPI001CC76E96|nr:hypothetical protein [Flavihumibacter profundi]MBZ5857739.1 hypothetical protein [Flavihumibacter profundi]
MQVFKIRQDGFKEIRKKMLLRSIPILLIAGTVGITISTMNSKQKENDVNVLPIVIPMAVLALGFGLYRGVNRQRLLFESYTLTITNNLITREQLNTPTISIYFNDVKEIAKHKNGSFIIKGKGTVNLIGIPAQIDDYFKLETALQQIQPIVIKDNVSLLKKYQSFTGLVTVGLMLCVYTVNNNIIVGLTGSALVALMISSFVKIRSNKNVDSKTKRSVWWVLLVLVSVIVVMIFKLTGLVNMQNH